MQKGDRIISIGGTPIETWNDISKTVAKHNKEVVPVVVSRDGATISLEMIPKTDTQSNKAVLGVMPVITEQSHGFLESASMAVTRTGTICKMMLVGLYEMVTGAQKAEVAGPLGVAQLAGQVASVGFVNLLMFTAFLSLNLGILNLLPIPMLDGGYIILLLLEGMTGRRMPKQALRVIQTIGMVILGALFIFAMFQDISRF